MRYLVPLVACFVTQLFVPAAYPGVLAPICPLTQVPGDTHAIAPLPDPKPYASRAERDEYCRADSTRLVVGLTETYDRFKLLGTRATVSQLIDLDGRIRILVDQRSPYRPCGDDTKFYDARWTDLGIVVDHEMTLEYSGLLLQMAYDLDRDGAFREWTLFSTIYNRYSEAGLPDIDRCREYEKQFPNGPFAKDVYFLVACFHKDLFMVLRDGQNDYKRQCYQHFVTDSPVEVQREAARQIALDYFDKVLAIDPHMRWAREFRDRTADGQVRAWSFCGC